MASKKKPAGEGKLGLIIALTFFVLTSIALGVFAYQFNEKYEDEVKKIEAAKTSEANATKLVQAERKRVAMYKAYAGVATDDDMKLLDGVPSTDPVRAEQVALMDSLRGKLKAVSDAEARLQAGKGGAGDPFSFDAGKFVVWNWPEGGNLPRSMTSGSARDLGKATTIPEEMIKYLAASDLTRRLAVKDKQNADADIKAAKDATAAADAAKMALETARDEAVKEKAKVVKELADAKAAAAMAYDAEVKQFAQKAAVIGREKNTLEQDKEALKIALAEKQEQVEAVRKKEETKKAVLPFDKAKGKVVSRRGNVVEINLGSSDNLRVNETFSVQPLDYGDKGEQSRIRQVVDLKGRPVKDREGNVLKMFQPKGTIEVIEILGPNLAKAQVTGEYDPTREAIMEEDLIYNAAWNKGNREHVVLFGIFDVDGNGTDDIKQVERELEKAGVTVDGYFDLATRKWAKGAPTERTAYAIRGEFPMTLPGAVGEGLGKEKDAIIASLSRAKDEAEKKGAKVISYRDFFPRVGYKVAYGLPDDTINQAAAKYLMTAEPPPAPEMPKN